jgi:rubrerythrin
MKQWNSVNEILDFAINNEQEAHDFYMNLSAKMERPWMTEIFKKFAAEEMGHKKKLEGVKSGKNWGPSDKKSLDLKIGD